MKVANKTELTDFEQEYIEQFENIEKAVIKCHLTDIGNGKRLAIHFGHKLRYCHDIKSWLAYDGHRWNLKTGDEMARSCAKTTALGLYDEAKIRKDEREKTARWAIASEKEARINAMLSMAQDEPPISAYSDSFDIDPFTFNAQDWVIDLRTGSVTPQQPEQNITQIGGCKFDETATAPFWEKCVKEWMLGDASKIDYLQRVLGMCLTGDISARIFPIFYGDGFNGKSKCLDAIMEILGDYAALGPEDLLAEKKLSSHPCDIYDLKGRRLVVIDESKKGMRLRTSLVKRMTGDMKLKARAMRQNFEQFTVTHKIILMTQNLPVITETSEAIWDRVHLLKWGAKYPEDNRDTKVLEKLRPEYPGILNWLIKGCLKWQADNNIMKRPESVKTSTLLYKEESDPLGEFVDEKCVIDDRHTVPKKEMRSCYEQWADDTNRYKFTRQNFNAYLRERGATDVSLKISGNAVKCWQGIGLQENF